MSRIAKAAAVAVGTGAVVVSGAGLALADAGAQSAAVGSPGVVSGNVIQVPIHIPVNVCGNTVDIIALLNPAFGNACVNDGGKGGRPASPATPARVTTATAATATAATARTAATATEPTGTPGKSPGIRAPGLFPCPAACPAPPHAYR